VEVTESPQSSPVEDIPGRRISAGWPRPELDVLRQFTAVPTSVVGDAMNRLGVMSGEIGRICGGDLLGAALPILVRSGDNLMIHRGIAVAKPGDVLVINGQGSLAHGLFGELMARAALDRGIVGVVVDGAVRDRAALESLGLPVFARGVCSAGPSKEGTGEVGYPVACGRVVVCAGDLVIGDADGIAVVPLADAEQVVGLVADVQRWEEHQFGGRP
jgi:4-hydroxy-4-methyl-2-oxoglutarate aldolase